MKKISQNNLENNEVIRASEIGQYYFCSNAWYLQKCGHKPVSKYLKIGIKKHENLGKIIEETQNKTRNSKLLVLLSCLLFLIAIIIIIFEVIK